MRYVFFSLLCGVGMLYLWYDAVGYINNLLGFG